MSKTSPTTVLVFQIGSLGDTVIALPCYREIARRHPGAKIYLLTNHASGSKMVPAETILNETGLIHGTVHYPMPLRNFSSALELYRRLRELRADILYYLTPEKRITNMVRHCAFFRLAGIRRVVGVPWTRRLQSPLKLKAGELWESEASRLLRTLKPSRRPEAPADADRDLNLTVRERAVAEQSLSALGDFIAVSVGGKVPINNWGDQNWQELLTKLGKACPGMGLLLVGSADEYSRNEMLAVCWTGPTLNSCGRFSPRETAALIERARLFVGHDTGTLHLAAAVKTPIVGVFSGRHMPGRWFSDRETDSFVYHKTECFNCECFKVSDCKFDRRCMTAISPDFVLGQIRKGLRSNRVESRAITAEAEWAQDRAGEPTGISARRQ